VLRVNYLRGPNIWTYRPALEVWLDLGELEDHPSTPLPGFNDRLTALAARLEEHHCGVGERGGFPAAAARRHLVLAMCWSMSSSSCSTCRACPRALARRAAPAVRGVYRMVFRARDEQVARMALAKATAC
jgi:cyanophycin synthetase